MAESLCVFCEQGDLGVEKVGETFQKDGVTVHENCLVNFTIDHILDDFVDNQISGSATTS